MANRYNPQHETSAVDDFTPTPFTDDQIDRVRRVMAEAAVRAGREDELEDTLMMLGIMPNQEIDNFTTDPSFLQTVSLPGKGI
jgi:hypothetical protein